MLLYLCYTVMQIKTLFLLRTLWNKNILLYYCKEYFIFQESDTISQEHIKLIKINKDFNNVT